MSRDKQCIQKYFEQRKSFCNFFFSYIEDADYLNLLNEYIKDNKLTEKNNFIHILRFVLSVCNNHSRESCFFEKIKTFFLFYKDEIKQTFSNYQIFNIFEGNKLLLLYLFKDNIIEADKSISEIMLDKIDQNGTKYCHFFLPEIKEFIDKEKITKIEKELLSYDRYIFENFEEKRDLGENDSYICSLIRKDSIEEFITYVNKNNICLGNKIKESLFETNQFLIENEPTIIEYAAFFGSIQIFQYLQYNNVELTPSLWPYVIHSNNPELLHILEEKKITPEDKTYLQCYEEAIKCHHNDFANYIETNLLNHEEINNLNEIVSNCSFHYYNYLYFAKNYFQSFVFYNLCKYNYTHIVDKILTLQKDSIENIKILNQFYFTYKIF